MKRWLLALSIAVLSACGQYSIRNIDKPAPRSYEGWLNADGAEMHWMEARRALLECGAPAPDTNGFVYKQALGIDELDDRLRYAFMVQGCMEFSGLRQRWSTLREDCHLYPRYSIFPACQPDATFPKRSVERRLNSWYCKVKTDRAYCREHAFTPSACDDPKNDYNNPPPECLP